MHLPAQSSTAPAFETSLDGELTLLGVMSLLRRRQLSFRLTVLAVVVLSVLYALLSTKIYEASGTLQIQKDSTSGLGLESMLGGSASDASDSLGANVNLQTQADILQSNGLALQVIEELHLEKRKSGNLADRLLFWTKDGAAAQADGLLADSPKRTDAALSDFQKHLTVHAIAGTKLIEVRYGSPDPRLSAEVVNHLIQALRDYTFRTRYIATTETSEWLTGQLSDLRRQSEEGQARVVALQKRRGIVSLGQKADGTSDAYSSTLDQLRQATAGLSEAESNRILKGAIYSIVKNGNAEMISGLSGNSLGSGSTAVNNSLQLIQSLRSQQAQLESQIALDESKFGPAYPRLIEIKSQLKAVQLAIGQEIDRIRERSRNDYEVAVKTEADTRALYGKFHMAADKLNDLNIEFDIARQEATQNTALYEDLLRRLKEAGVLEGLKASNVTIVDHAIVPYKPIKPKRLLILAVGCGLGCFLGLAVAFLVELVDNRIYNADEIEGQLGLSLFGLLPLMDPVDPTKPHKLELVDHPRSVFSESIRSTASALMLARGGQTPQVILVTSAVPGEGKSTVSLNLAISCALSGKRVLLVECDMRRPVIAKRLGLNVTQGLSQILAGLSKDQTSQTIETVPGLDILAGGAIPPSPADLLGSGMLDGLLTEWRTSYDLIVLDMPPVLPVADARIVAAKADVVVLIARSGITTRPSLQRTQRLMLERMKINTIGVVLNGIRRDSDAYLSYYGYANRNYEAYYGAQGGSNNG